MTKGDFKAILEAGDVEACVAYFEGAVEDERKAVAAQALEWYRVQKATGFIQEGNTYRINPLLAAANAAVLATSSFSQLKKLSINLTRSDTDFRILKARKPGWMNEFVQWSLEKLPAVWPGVRRLERAGLCERPETDSYILGMIECLATRDGKPDVRTAFLEERELLGREIWNLFVIEGSGEFSLAARDKYSRHDATWEAGLIALANEGILPRDRLLDASLDALDRDFAQFRAGWFSRFHEALEPTIEERAARSDRYLNLLASKIPPTVSFAMSALTRLDRAKQLPANLVVERIAPALIARAKVTVLPALKLLENAANREPRFKNAAAITASRALAHESPDAQAEALAMIVRIGDRHDENLVAAVRREVERLAPSVQPMAWEWLSEAIGESIRESGSEPSPDGNFDAFEERIATIDPRFSKLSGIDAILETRDSSRFDPRAIGFDGTEFPRLDPAQSIRPIVDIDELIDVFSAVLENPDLTDDVERVLDGLSRLCDQRPADFETLVKPLRKRAAAIAKRQTGSATTGLFMGRHLVLDLCGLALAWTGGISVDAVDAPFTQTHASETVVWSKRARAVARRAVFRQAEPLLSAPTHRDGWIDPLILVDRIGQRAETDSEADRHDQVLAILRLAPDHREEARLGLAKFDDEFTTAARYALGGTVDEIGPTAALWIAAARARSPFEDDALVSARHPGLGPDASAAAKYGYAIKLGTLGTGKSYARFFLEREPKVPPLVSSEFPTVLCHTRKDDYELSRDTATLRWGATVWPIGCEAWLAQGVEAIAANLDWWEARWSNRVYLEALVDPDLPMKPMALILLTLGLAAKQADESGLATDGLVAAIDDGRIDGPILGGAMRSLLPTTLVMSSRWAKTLGDVARVSPLHAWIVASAIQEALRDELEEKPRDLLTLLELLKQLLIELGQGITLNPLRQWLKNWKTSGKTGKVVKELLALNENQGNHKRHEAALLALEHRAERAERWSRLAASALR